MRRRLGGLVLVTHPFPSILDGLVTAAIALIAGGGWGSALSLGLSMTTLQGSIGALNDIVDAPSDAVGRPSKPIPAGLVGSRVALGLAAVLALVGLALAARSGLAALGLGAVILAIGAAYDLVFKASRWSRLPFAVGIPLLPVFAWLGAADRLPAAFAVLVPAAVGAGAALALGNSLVDLEGDARAGDVTPPQAWSATRVRAAATLLNGLVVLAALATGLAGGLSPAAVVAVGALGLVLVGAGRWGTAGRRPVRERAWQVQAAAVGGLAATWLGGLAAAGALR